MKILVTGGTGFTGGALVDRLITLGHDINVIDYKKGLRYEELKNKGANIRLGSITDYETVDEMTKGVEFVFHIAAAFRELDVPREHYYNVNVNGTRNVMKAAMKYKVPKVVYCSTQGVHGHIKNPPGDENSPIAPEDYYQQTKYEGELVVKEFMEKGLTATIIRPTAIYGPGDPERYFMIYKRAARGSFPMFGDGSTYYHPVYIDNLVDAFILSMDLSKGNNSTYIIADKEYVHIRDLVKEVGNSIGKAVKIHYYPITPLIIAGHVCEKVCKPLNIAPPIFPRRVDWFRQVRAFKIDKAERELGYQAKIDLKEGLKRTAEWYIKQGLLKV